MKIIVEHKSGEKRAPGGSRKQPMNGRQLPTVPLISKDVTA
jgi:hypothetical protein